MVKIEFIAGKRYYYQRNPIRLVRVLNMHQVVGEYEATGALVTIPVNQLEPISAEDTPAEPPVDDLLYVSDKAWAKAQQKFSIIQPLIAEKVSKQMFAQVAAAHQVSIATLYRWIRAYKETNSVHSLLDIPKTGGAGRTRLNPEVDVILQQAIKSEYLTTQKKKPTKVMLEIQQQCRRAGLVAPGVSTVRRRINQLSEEEKVRLRWSKKMAKEQFEPLKGSIPGADFPLAIVQVDHTPVDVILVDERYRQPLGRPNLTLATDVFSRMVVGFYLSFDPIGSVAVGMCLAHAILPKETWLSNINVQGDWLCWGVPTVLHLDNAKEFRGKMLERACEKYGTRIEFRPVGTPNYAGNIERMMRTFMQETHTLPGTTFSNVQERKEYSSEKKAALTLKEYEQWLTVFIVNVYHKRVHQSIHTSPARRYEEGIMGAPGQLATGLPAMLPDELQVRLDFMPDEERTVQEYGVVIDHVHYYADVLKPYINTLEEGYGKNRRKRKFLFKRDPRNISCLYFPDPVTKQYHRIPYRNTAHPAISVWEFRQALNKVKQQGKEHVDENAIFDAFEEMKKIELAAVERTRQINKTTNRILKGAPLEISSLLPSPGTVSSTIQADTDEEPAGKKLKPSLSNGYSQTEGLKILPYDDIYDAAFD